MNDALNGMLRNVGPAETVHHNQQKLSLKTPAVD